MKKVYQIVLILITFSLCGKSKINNEEYYKIKKTGDIKSIQEYYLKEIDKEQKKIEEDLYKIYKDNRDEEAISYIFKVNVEEYKKAALEIYSNKIIEKCENKDCSDRLIKFYYGLYDKIKDIEIIGELLEYSDYIEKSKYDEIQNFAINNKSFRAIKNYNFQKSIKIEEQNKNKKLNIKGESYRVIQKEENINIKNKIITIFLVVSENKSKLYLAVKKDNVYELKEVSDYYLGYFQILKILDMNGDDEKEIVIETQFPNNVYIFSLNDEKIEEKFNTSKDIDINKYYIFKIETENILKEIKDDFGYYKKELISLPNPKEVLETNSESENNITIFNNYAIINDKIILRRAYVQSFEIIFDKTLDFKLKAIDNNSDLKLSTGYFY